VFINNVSIKGLVTLKISISYTATVHQQQTKPDKTKWFCHCRHDPVYHIINPSVVTAIVYSTAHSDHITAAKSMTAIYRCNLLDNGHSKWIKSNWIRIE